MNEFELIKYLSCDEKSMDIKCDSTFPQIFKVVIFLKIFYLFGQSFSFFKARTKSLIKKSERD